MLVLEELISILSEQFSIKKSDINYNTNIFKDLNADSLDVVDLFYTISSKFGLDIDESKMKNFKTVGDITKYIEDNTESKT